MCKSALPSLSVAQLKTEGADIHYINRDESNVVLIFITVKTPLKVQLGYKQHTGVAESVKLKPLNGEHCRLALINFMI